MNPAGAAKPLVIETRRNAAARARFKINGSSVSGLRASLADQSQTINVSEREPSAKLSRTGAEQHVPFRDGNGAPHLDSAFVAQLLGQALADRSRPRLDALAAYEPACGASRLYDRVL